MFEHENLLNAWDRAHNTMRLWAKDSKLWTDSDESSWLGWLDIYEKSRNEIDRIRRLVKNLKEEGFTDCVLLGMGGSSLGPQVLKESFGDWGQGLRFQVLDSTDENQVLSTQKGIDPSKTIFVVSSKSGTTLETRILCDYFFELVKRVVGFEKAGSHFVAITDPGTPLENLGRSKGFREIFFGQKNIGGRFSVLSNFGIVPAGLMGVDIERLLGSAEKMAHACSPSVNAIQNPGISLGLQLADLAMNQKKDKITFFISNEISSLSRWLQQLIGESTGKNETGFIPISEERISEVSSYNDDRVFVAIRLEDDKNDEPKEACENLTAAGHPVINIDVKNSYELGAEFFRWQIAVAAAASIMKVNPFDQPDVEVSKKETLKILSSFPNTVDSGFDTQFNSLELKEFLSKIERNDYFSICAFLENDSAIEKILVDIRSLVQSRKRVATYHGFGPGFLHSTGQLFKGGKNSGVFLQITCDYASRIKIPDQDFSFSDFIWSQALGDRNALNSKGRRVKHIHIGSDALRDLAKLKEEIEKALE